jgi:hypothetical protein
MEDLQLVPHAAKLGLLVWMVGKARQISESASVATNHVPVVIDVTDKVCRYISSLQDRVRWLEESIKQNCPEFDLNQGPRVLHENNFHEPLAPAHLQSRDQRQATPAGNSIPFQGGDVQHRNTIETHQSPDANDTQPERLAHEIGLVSVTGGQDLRYVGPSSGYSFAKLVLASASRRRVESLARVSFSVTIGNGVTS